MGSSGYLTCGMCHECGNCYPRKSACPACGGPIDLDGEACASCGRPVTEDMRLAAREAFRERKRLELLRDFADVAVRAPGPPSGPVEGAR